MKKKLLIFITLLSLLIFALSISVFAIPDMTEYSGPDPSGNPIYADHYGRPAHDCQSGCELCPMYDDGYNDGLDDGYEKGRYDAEQFFASYMSPDEVQEQINNYKNTDVYKAEFNQAVADALAEHLKNNNYSEITKADILSTYKNSTEYQQALNDKYNEGLSAGQNVGYSLGLQSGTNIGYAQGYADGKSEFRASNAYQNDLENSANAGYSLGYDDGYNDASLNQKNSNPIQIIILFLTLIILIAIAISLSMYLKKKKGR